MPDFIHEAEGVFSILKFNRKDVRNAVNEEIMQGLTEALDSLETSNELRAVILTGEGEEAFCSGGDLKWLQSFESREAGLGMSRRMQEIMGSLSALPVPVIAVLNGYALGGGTEIAMACDMRIIEEHAYMSFKQARVGLMTGWGGGGRLLRTNRLRAGAGTFDHMQRTEPGRCAQDGTCKRCSAERGGSSRRQGDGGRNF